MECKTFGAKRISEAGAAGVAAFEPRRLRSDGVEEPRAAAAAPPPPPPPQPKIDLDAVRKQAFQEGFAAGSESAEQKARQRYDAAVGGLRATVTALEQARPALLAEAEAEMVELAFAIAKRVLRREISVDPWATRAIAAACLQEAGGAAVKQIRVHPDDVAAVREGVGQSIEVRGDAAVSRGGAVLETERGTLDGRIETQLDEIARGLADA